MADEIIKLNSICTFCSGPARFSYRITEEEGTVVLEEKDNMFHYVGSVIAN